MTEELLKRLEAREEVQTWYDGGYRHTCLTNPDGPEAAALIRQLKSDNERMREDAVADGEALRAAMSCLATRIPGGVLNGDHAASAVCARLSVRLAQSLNQTERGGQ